MSTKTQDERPSPKPMTPRALPVSVKPPEEPHIRRALRVLAMVAELHKVGYQHLRICAGMSPSGCYWRCSITVSSNVGENGWEILDWDDLSAHYTSGQENRYFDWPDAPGKSARQLAAMFVERFPKIAAAGVGRDYAYAGWYIEMLGTAENGELPIFYSDWHDKPPPPAIPPTILRA